MDYRAAALFMMKDPKWLPKLGFATLLFLAPLVGLPVLPGLALLRMARPSAEFSIIIGAWVLLIIVLALPFAGYCMECARRAADGHQTPLPPWNDVVTYSGRAAVAGLILAAVSSVGFLPFALGMGTVAGIAEGGILSFGSWRLEIGTSSALLTAGTVTTLTGLLSVPLLGLVVPLMGMAYACTGRVAPMLRLSPIWDVIRRHKLDYTLALLFPTALSLGISTVLGMTLLGSALIPVAIAYTCLVQAHILGQFCRCAGWPNSSPPDCEQG